MRRSSVADTPTFVSFKNALNRTRAPDSRNPQGSLVSSTFQTKCNRLGGDREGQVARSTHRTQGEAHPLQEQHPEQMWRDELRSVGACAETTPGLRPEWYRRCARFEADWPDSMVLFRKERSEAEDAQYCQPCCHSPSSFDGFGGGRLPLRNYDQLGRSENPS